MKRWTARIDDPLLRALAYVELGELAVAYGVHEHAAPPVEVPNAAWAELMDAAASDTDGWYTANNLTFFRSLRELLPAFDTMLGQAIEQRTITGDTQAFADDWAILSTVFERAFSGASAEGCCQHYGANVEAADLWALYRNLALGNVLRRLDHSIKVQASYSTALNSAERLEPMLSGQPRFVILSALAHMYVSDSTQGAKREHLRRTAAKMANSVLETAKAIDMDTIQATEIKRAVSSRLPGEDLGTPYVQSWLSRGPWDLPSGHRYAEYRGEAEALPYTRTRFDVFMAAADNGIVDDSAAAEILASRFDGHPDKVPFQAQRLLEDERRADALALLEEAVKQAGGTSWKTYELLGDLYLRAGEYNRATTAFLRYPGFTTKSPRKPVAVSNHAYAAGDKLFWKGRYKEARELYRVAADLRTGAASGIRAAMRIALLDGDFPTALAHGFQGGRRYNDRHSFREYLSMLHLLGFHDKARAGFIALAPRYDGPELWDARFVGDRMRRRSIQEAASHAQDLVAQAGSARTTWQARRYLILQSIVDRHVSQASIGALAGVEGKRLPNRPISGGHLREVFPERDFRAIEASDRPSDGCGDGDTSQSNTPDPFETVLSGLLAVRRGAGGDALAAFITADCSHNLIAYDGLWLPMGYVAMAAAEVPNGEGADRLPALLESMQSDWGSNEFDVALVEAITRATHADRDGALDSLKDAFRLIPRTQMRPVFTWYQITETAEWLYHKTGDRRFIHAAMEWVRRYQVIQPQFAWAHAFRARYGENRDARIRATAHALYLDPASRWLGEVPEEIREQAKAWWRDHNPYAGAAASLNQPPAKAGTGT